MTHRGMTLALLVAAAGCSEGAALREGAVSTGALGEVRSRFPSLAPALERGLKLQRDVRGFRPVAPTGEQAPGHPGGAARRHQLKVAFPLRSAGALRISSGPVSVKVRALGILDLPAAVVGQALVFAGAHPAADVIHFAEAERVEELVLLRDSRAPRSFRYEVRPMAGADRVRQNVGVVEVIDRQGTAWLRLEDPFVIDAAGQRHRARARLQGSTLTVEIPAEVRAFPALLDPAWSTTKDMTTKRRRHTATLLKTGKVLVVGGYNDTGYVLGSCELYDPQTDTWTTTGSLTVKRFRHTALRLQTGKVLMFGGAKPSPDPMMIGSSVDTFSAELYDPTTGKWTPAGYLSYPRGVMTAALLPSGKVLLAGGQASSFLPSAQLYDPIADSWSKTGKMSMPRHLHTTTLLKSGKVLVAGTEKGMASDPSAELWDPASGTWSLTGSMSKARQGHRAVLLHSGKVLVTGSSTTGEVYDPATGKWSLTKSLSVPGRRHHSMTLLKSGKAMVAGGEVSSAHLDSVEFYDPSTNAWTAGSKLSRQLKYHTATLLSSGRVLVAGGLSKSGGTVASTELFDPTSGLGCKQASNCAAGFCVDGICCQTACMDTCRQCVLSGSVGKCVNAPHGTKDTNATVPCAGANSCDSSGKCVAGNGQKCTKGADCASGFCVDGRCCDKPCTAGCLACDLVGKEGTCNPMPLGHKDPGGLAPCTGNNACDGTGSCKLASGQKCANQAACATGYCVDTICCGSACAGTCQACDLPGTAGTCSMVAKGQPDPSATSPCITDKVCDGAGKCLTKQGQACSSATDCLAGFCKDGVCCDKACDSTCESCKLTGSVGTCTFIPSNTNPDKECQGKDIKCGGLCDGKGQCDYPKLGVFCDKCKACDGTGQCSATPPDDPACGVIDCDKLDTKCRDYVDLSTNRCDSLGQCKQANTPTTCTKSTDLQCDSGVPDSRAAVDLGLAADASTVGDKGPDIKPELPEEGGCSCQAGGAPGPGARLTMLTLIAIVGLATRRRRG